MPQGPSPLKSLPESLHSTPESPVSQPSTTPPDSENPPEQGLLSPAQRQSLAQAQKELKKILKAVRVATFNATTSLVLAAISLLFAWLSIESLLIGLGLAAIAWIEFRGRKLLNQLHPAGLRLLAWNQFALLGLITLYCLWAIYQSWASGNRAEEYSQYFQGNPELESMLVPLLDLEKTLSIVLYCCVIGASVIVQGLTALYYFRRLRMLEGYLKLTPAWILDLQRHLNMTA